MNSELSSHAEKLLEHLLKEHPLPRRPGLVWRRYRTTAGTANYQSWTINLSVHVLDSPEKLAATLRHEYAHLLTFARYGPKFGRGHGPAWRQVMRELGQDPIVRHTYETKRNARRQVVVYRCERCGEEIARHRRLPKNRKYAHLNCGGLVIFVGRVAA